jgi:hypothetical protein
MAFSGRAGNAGEAIFTIAVGVAMDFRGAPARHFNRCGRCARMAPPLNPMEEDAK